MKGEGPGRSSKPVIMVFQLGRYLGVGPKLPVVEELHRPRNSSFAGAEESAGDGEK